MGFRSPRHRTAVAVTLVGVLAAVATAAPAAAHDPSRTYPVRWAAYDTNPFSIPFYFAKGFPARHFRDRIRSATKQWNKLARGPVLKPHYEVAKKATAKSACNDVPNRQGLMQYASVPGNAIAVTARCIHNDYGAPRTMRSFVISFDSDEKKAWNKSTGSAKAGKKVDVQAVATHELGHVLGSEDYLSSQGDNKYCRNDLKQHTMCQIYYRGHERERTLEAHDKETFREAYPSPVWWADGERNYRHEWYGASNNGCTVGRRLWKRQSGDVQANPAQGNEFYDFQVRSSDDASSDSGQRCELGQALSPQEPRRVGFPQFQQGENDWIAWQVFLPATSVSGGPFAFNRFPGASTCHGGGSDFQAIAQWKQVDPSPGVFTGPPALAMAVENGRFCLNSSVDENATNDTAPNRDVGPANPGRWVKFSLHVKFSPSDSTGFVELWGDLDGTGVKQLWPVPGSANCPSQPCVEHIHTLKLNPDAPSQVMPSHSRIGIYRSKSISGNSDLFYDGYTVATSRQVAEANAFRP